MIADERLRPLSTAERNRYSRNILVPEVGAAGQRRIRAARVMLVGAGALGAPGPPGPVAPACSRASQDHRGVKAVMPS